MSQLNEFWIDVGGTFTDCLMRTTDGTISTFKVLSSGVTKGRVTKVLGPHSFNDAARIGDASRFWEGYAISMLNPTGEVLQSGQVVAFDEETGSFTLDQALDASVATQQFARYELKRGAFRSAPVQAA